MKKTFFTSDWHIGHEKALEYDQRPFKDLDHMHRVLVNNYNACVSNDDICYFLGDIGFSNTETTKGVISQLNGTRVCILGNHDKGKNAMYSMGFDLVLSSASFHVGDDLVTMSHCPLRGVFRELTEGMKNAAVQENWHGERRHSKFSIPDNGQFHLHGHIHSGPANEKLKIDGRQMDVGVPANKYRPVSMSEIESWIAKYKKDLLETILLIS